MRRQIMALVVGLTTLVILAFAIPVALLIRSSVVQNAERAAVLQANNVALTIRTNNSQSAIESYLKVARTEQRPPHERAHARTEPCSAPRRPASAAPASDPAAARRRGRRRTWAGTTAHPLAERAANRPS